MRTFRLHFFLRYLLTPLALIVPMALFGITPAKADLRVCNETQDPVSIALGYHAERGWQSEGWWVAGPSDCAIVFQGDLNARFYYLFAVDDVGGGAWDGSVFMCTRDEVFTIFGVEDCLARGYERTGFFEVDTQNRSDWTLQLAENQSIEEGDVDSLGDAPPMENLPGEEIQPEDLPEGELPVD